MSPTRPYVPPPSLAQAAGRWSGAHAGARMGAGNSAVSMTKKLDVILAGHFSMVASFERMRHGSQNI